MQSANGGAKAAAAAAPGAENLPPRPQPPRRLVNIASRASDDTSGFTAHAAVAGGDNNAADRGHDGAGAEAATPRPAPTPAELEALMAADEAETAVDRALPSRSPSSVRASTPGASPRPILAPLILASADTEVDETDGGRAPALLVTPTAAEVERALEEAMSLQERESTPTTAAPDASGASASTEEPTRAAPGAGPEFSAAPKVDAAPRAAAASAASTWWPLALPTSSSALAGVAAAAGVAVGLAAGVVFVWRARTSTRE